MYTHPHTCNDTKYSSCCIGVTHRVCVCVCVPMDEGEAFTPVPEMREPESATALPATATARATSSVDKPDHAPVTPTRRSAKLLPYAAWVPVGRANLDQLSREGVDREAYTLLLYGFCASAFIEHTTRRSIMPDINAHDTRSNKSVEHMITEPNLDAANGMCATGHAAVGKPASEQHARDWVGAVYSARGHVDAETAVVGALPHRHYLPSMRTLLDGAYQQLLTHTPPAHASAHAHHRHAQHYTRALCTMLLCSMAWLPWQLDQAGVSPMSRACCVRLLADDDTQDEEESGKYVCHDDYLVDGDALGMCACAAPPPPPADDEPEERCHVPHDDVWQRRLCLCVAMEEWSWARALLTRYATGVHVSDYDWLRSGLHEMARTEQKQEHKAGELSSSPSFSSSSCRLDMADSHRAPFLTKADCTPLCASVSDVLGSKVHISHAAHDPRAGASRDDGRLDRCAARAAPESAVCIWSANESARARDCLDKDDDTDHRWLRLTQSLWAQHHRRRRHFRHCNFCRAASTHTSEPMHCDVAERVCGLHALLRDFPWLSRSDQVGLAVALLRPSAVSQHARRDKCEEGSNYSTNGCDGRQDSGVDDGKDKKYVCEETAHYAACVAALRQALHVLVDSQYAAPDSAVAADADSVSLLLSGAVEGFEAVYTHAHSTTQSTCTQSNIKRHDSYESNDIHSSHSIHEHEDAHTSHVGDGRCTAEEKTERHAVTRQRTGLPHYAHVTGDVTMPLLYLIAYGPMPDAVPVASCSPFAPSRTPCNTSLSYHYYYYPCTASLSTSDPAAMHTSDWADIFAHWTRAHRDALHQQGHFVWRCQHDRYTRYAYAQRRAATPALPCTHMPAIPHTHRRRNLHETTHSTPFTHMDTSAHARPHSSCSRSNSPHYTVYNTQLTSATPTTQVHREGKDTYDLGVELRCNCGQPMHRCAPAAMHTSDAHRPGGAHGCSATLWSLTAAGRCARAPPASGVGGGNESPHTEKGGGPMRRAEAAALTKACDANTPTLPSMPAACSLSKPTTWIKAYALHEQQDGDDDDVHGESDDARAEACGGAPQRRMPRRGECAAGGVSASDGRHVRPAGMWRQWPLSTVTGMESWLPTHSPTLPSASGGANEPLTRTRERHTHGSKEGEQADVGGCLTAAEHMCTPSSSSAPAAAATLPVKGAVGEEEGHTHTSPSRVRAPTQTWTASTTTCMPPPHSRRLPPCATSFSFSATAAPSAGFDHAPSFPSPPCGNRRCTEWQTPLCVVCGSRLESRRAGAAEVYQPDLFYVWCTRCLHGGHWSHVRDWLARYGVCSVEGCACRCCWKGSRGTVQTGEDAVCVVNEKEVCLRASSSLLLVPSGSGATLCGESTDNDERNQQQCKRGHPFVASYLPTPSESDSASSLCSHSGSTASPTATISHSSQRSSSSSSSSLLSSSSSCAMLLDHVTGRAWHCDVCDATVVQAHRDVEELRRDGVMGGQQSDRHGDCSTDDYLSCSRCGHGGHAHHVRAWLARHGCCAVPQCGCACRALWLKRALD